MMETYLDYEEDLFGPENEDYMRTYAFSHLAPPNLSLPQQFFGSRGNDGLGNRQAFASPMKIQVGLHGGHQMDDKFVAELRFGKDEETLRHSCPLFQEPSEIACYSRTFDGSIYYDDRCLRRFDYGVLEKKGIDLNVGFETFVDKREDMKSEGFGDLLACLRNTSIPLDNMHFVTFRNNLNKILGTVYNRSEGWEMGVHKRRGTIYLDVHKLPEGRQNDRQHRMCYWGYSFEEVATGNYNESHEDVVDANVEYCVLVKTKLGAHRIIMGAEMDCYDIGRDGKKRYIELKTSREVNPQTIDRFEKEKLLKFWIQSFLAGVPKIVCAFRDDSGKITRVEQMGTKEISQRVKQKNFWQGGVCLAFADRVLCWLFGTVTKEDEDYVLRFLPGSNRLELLRSNYCPEVIKKHVDLLP